MGGGIGVFSNSSPIIKENTITFNSADSVGGGISCIGYSNPQIINNIIKNNEADYGGGIHCFENSNPIIVGNTIDSNKANISGGGIRLRDASSPTITNNMISNNMADSTGGGIGCFDNSNATIIGNTIDSNSVMYFGGGISCDNWSSPDIKNNTISNNIAGKESGGIDCYDNSSPQIIDNLIENNSSIFGGGIKCSRYSSPLIKDNTVTGNIADTSGGGILVHNYSAANIIDNIITFNETTTQYGAGIRCGTNLYQPIIRGCTISQNIGDGISCRSSSPIIDSCTIKNNTYDGIMSYANAQPEIHYCDIEGNGLHGIRNGDPAVIVNAENNWWGHETGPSGVGPGSGDSVSLYVDYDPWLVNPVLEVSEEEIDGLPTDFDLSQNYPNPFNPSTKIRYSVPQSSNVLIKVFDILGNEIETLVDEEKLVGTYEITWYAEQLPSGIYFYQLQTPNFTQTKKMILLK